MVHPYTIANWITQPTGRLTNPASHSSLKEKLMAEKYTEYIGSEFNLILMKCMTGGMLNRKTQAEAIILLKGPDSTDISTYIIEKIMKCILSLQCLLPIKGAVGTQHKLEISFVSQPTYISPEKWLQLGIDRVINKNQHRALLHATIKFGSVTRGDSGIIALDLRVTFHAGGIKIGDARYQIFPSTTYDLKA
jgi:hypothetical protein